MAERRNRWPFFNFALALTAFAAIEIALIFNGPVEDPLLNALTPLLGVLYCAAGRLLSYRRPLNRTGGLLIFGGIAWFASGLASTGIEPLIAVGQVVRNLPVVVTLHLLFVFPSGRTQSRLDRVGLFILYFAAIVLYMPAYLFESRPSPYDVLFLEEREGLADVASLLRSSITWLVSIAIIANLVRRYRRATVPLRHAYRPFVMYAILALIATPLTFHLASIFVEFSPSAFSTLFRVALAGMPVSILVAAGRGGFAPVSPLSELAGQLGEKTWGDDLEATLGEAVGDPTLRIAFRMADGRLLSGSGEKFELARQSGSVSDERSPKGPGHLRAECEISFGGEPLGLINYDPSLVSAAEVRATASVAAAWIEQNRLSTALQISERELLTTYRQAMQSADSERRRIAQDLHDGLASRLVMLAIKVQGVVPQGGTESDLQRQVAELGQEIQRAIAELRALVQDLMPADLVELGLLPALRRLVSDAPLVGELEAQADLGPVPREVQRSAYLIVAEAISNTIRHAGAETLRVSVERTVSADDTAGEMIVQVSDDGIGGAAPGPGTGLDGMALRAASHGGEMKLDSPPGGGTTVTVTLTYATEHVERSSPRPSGQATESR